MVNQFQHGIARPVSPLSAQAVLKVKRNVVSEGDGEFNRAERIGRHVVRQESHGLLEHDVIAFVGPSRNQGIAKIGAGHGNGPEEGAARIVVVRHKSHGGRGRKHQVVAGQRRRTVPVQPGVPFLQHATAGPGFRRGTRGRRQQSEHYAREK